MSFFQISTIFSPVYVVIIFISHFIFALGNTCGLRIFCIHFGFKSYGLIKLITIWKQRYIN